MKSVLFARFQYTPWLYLIWTFSNEKKIVNSAPFLKSPNVLNQFQSVATIWIVTFFNQIFSKYYYFLL